MKLFVVCPGGLEAPLANELLQIAQRPEVLALGKSKIDPAPLNLTGGIGVEGSLGLAMAINLHSRIASRVLLKMGEANYRQEEDIYRLARGLGWEDWFSPSQTMRVDLTAQRSPLKSLNFATLRIKDAIVDRLREIKGERPNINTANPDIRIQAHLTATQVTLYLDTSGEPLFKRGWREEKGEAPLKENLAAGIIALTGWQASLPLLDPMCGSGTFLIEAAQIALKIPSGALRAGFFEPATSKSKQKRSGILRGFGFEALKPFSASLEEKNWAHLCRASQLEIDQARNTPLLISGGDINEQLITIAKLNWQRAYLPGLPNIRQIDALAIKPSSDQAGIILFNPPYGERLNIKGGRGQAKSSATEDVYSFGEAEIQTAPPGRSSREPLIKAEIDPQFGIFLDQFSKRLKDLFSGWQVFVLTADMGFPGHLRMKESKRTPLFNGPLECRLFRFEMRARKE